MFRTWALYLIDVFGPAIFLRDFSLQVVDVSAHEFRHGGQSPIQTLVAPRPVFGQRPDLDADRRLVPLRLSVGRLPRRFFAFLNSRDA